MQASITLTEYYKDVGETSLGGLIQELGTLSSAASGGDTGRVEAMLVAQAHTLDAIFNKLARKRPGNTSSVVSFPARSSSLPQCDGCSRCLDHLPHVYRVVVTAPILTRFHDWLVLQRQRATKGTPLAKAIDYSLKRWAALTRFADDGDLPPDNNHLENRMRPIALGRLNWLFAG